MTSQEESASFIIVTTTTTAITNDTPNDASSSTPVDSITVSTTNGSSSSDSEKISSSDDSSDAKVSSKFRRFFSSLRQFECISLANMVIMCLVLVGYGMCTSLFSPFFPNEATHKGMGPTTIGVLFGCYEFIMFIGTPICSKIVGHLGLRFMIWSGMLLAGGATILFGVVDQSPNGTTYIVLCFAVRIVEAIGASLYLTASYCIAGKMFPHNIAFVYSLIETVNSVGGMIGPSAGGLLYEAAGFYLPFVTVGTILLILGFISTVFLPATAVSRHEFVVEIDADGKKTLRKVRPNEGDDEQTRKNKKKSQSWSRLFRRSFEAWIITLTEAVSAILSSYPEPTISIYLESLGLDDKSTIGGIFLASSVVYTIVCISVGHFADKYPNHIYYMLTSGALLTAFSFFIMGPPPTVQHLVVPSIALTATGEITLYAGIALLMIPAPRALMTIAKDVGYTEGLETSAMIAGLYNGLWFMGGFSGPVLAGYLLETVGFQWGATIMTITALALVPILIIGATYRNKKRY